MDANTNDFILVSFSLYFLKYARKVLAMVDYITRKALSSLYL